MRGEAGNDTLDGGPGEDWLRGGPGNDAMVGGDGFDRADYRDSAAGIEVDLAAGVATDGMGGNDTLLSIERVIGTDFDDILIGDAGDNSFTGEQGDDVINGGDGRDYVWYGRATDAVSVELATGQVSGGEGNDTLVSIEMVGGSNFGDTLLGNGVDNWFDPDWEDNDTTPNYTQGGTDTIDGRGGQDGVWYGNAVSGIIANLATGTATDGNGNIDTLTNIEMVFGSDHDDTLIGDGADNVFWDGAGDDTVEGAGGDDRFILGQQGSDTIDGGSGSDTLVQTLETFDPGDPNFVYELDLPNSYSGAADNPTLSDTITNVENLELSGDIDTEFTGNAADNRVLTDAGDDVISTGGGADTLDGRGGDDIYEGGSGRDTFIIGPGNNRIKDFTPGTDILESAGLGLTEAEFISALQQAQDDGQGNALVTFGNGNSLLFDDLTADQAATILEPFQPAPPAAPPAWTVGDPHIVTFDEVGYDFHAIGEFVLARGTAGGDFAGFEVQSRMGEVTDAQGETVRGVSANVAVAARLGNGSQVMIDSTDGLPLSINGATRTLAEGGVLQAGADRIFREGDTYTVVFSGADNTVNDGDARLSVVVRDGRLDIGMQVSEAMSGQVEGLLGDSDGNPDNDIALANGHVLERPLAFEDLYGNDAGDNPNLRDSWRVTTEDDSLFTYDAGESLAGFYDPDAPADVPAIGDFDPADVDAARDAVSNAGLEPGTVPFENAVLDVLLTDDESFIESSADDTAPTTEATGSAGTLDEGETRVTIDVALEDADGAAIEGAIVNFTAGGAPILGQTGAAPGDYEIRLGSNSDPGRVDAQRGFEEGDADIGVGDALDVLRMAVGLDTSFGPAAPENLIAGDIDQSGDVSVGDALDVLRFAVGLEIENAPKWVFRDEDQDLSAVDRDNVDYETGIDTGAIADGLGLEMTGVLLGDLSAQPEA